MPVTILYFGSNQNLVFVPALFALLAATVVICLPIIFAPSLRKSPRRVPLIALAVVVGVVALVGTGIFAGTGFRTLGNERAAVQSWIAKTYGLKLDSGEVGELVDGGEPLRALPEVASSLGLKDPTGEKTLKLLPKVKGGDVYELYFGKKLLPAS